MQKIILWALSLLISVSCFSQNVEKLYEKGDALYISEKYKEALEKVAKANQYSYILDKKMLLYADGGIDATEKIKTALGISW